MNKIKEMQYSLDDMREADAPKPMIAKNAPENSRDG